MRMYDEIRLAPLRFPRDREVSPLLAELLSRMLAKDPGERMTLPQIMSHPWITHNGTAPLACLQVPCPSDRIGHVSVLYCTCPHMPANACCKFVKVSRKRQAQRDQQLQPAPLCFAQAAPEARVQRLDPEGVACDHTLCLSATAQWLP